MVWHEVRVVGADVGVASVGEGRHSGSHLPSALSPGPEPLATEARCFAKRMATGSCPWDAGGSSTMAARYACAAMVYDEELAHRLRELLSGENGITEKAMFGGLAFLVHGNMAVSASRNGGLLVRIDPADSEAALARPHVALMEMGGRTMAGWITVLPEGLKTKRQLAQWVKRALTFVKTLPPKQGTARAKKPSSPIRPAAR